ncbi:MAG: glycogen-binding domain-containing protein [Pseudomonadota bacterium]
MSKDKSKGTAKRHRVTLSLELPAANEVFLMGDFNDWNPTMHPMKKDGSGVWKKMVMLFPGKYEYRFMVDGEWVNDPNGQLCPNCFGTFNNVVEVPMATKSV